LVRNQNNVSVWSDMSIREQSFQWANTKNPTADLIIVLFKINLFSP